MQPGGGRVHPICGVHVMMSAKGLMCAHEATRGRVHLRILVIFHLLVMCFAVCRSRYGIRIGLARTRLNMLYY